VTSESPGCPAVSPPFFSSNCHSRSSKYGALYCDAILEELFHRGNRTHVLLLGLLFFTKINVYLCCARYKRVLLIRLRLRFVTDVIIRCVTAVAPDAGDHRRPAQVYCRYAWKVRMLVPTFRSSKTCVGTGPIRYPLSSLPRYIATTRKQCLLKRS